MNNKWKSRKIVIAVTIAIIADTIQLGLGVAELSGALFVPAEILDVMLDFAVAGAMCFLVGFHWLLLPTMFAEFIPGLSLFPTWTGCTFYVIGQKHNAAVQKKLVVEVEQLKATTPPPLPTILPVTDHQIAWTPPQVTSPLQLPLKSANGAEQTCEAKLQRLLGMFDNRLISQAELDAKRQQILSEL